MEPAPSLALVEQVREEETIGRRTRSRFGQDFSLLSGALVVAPLVEPDALPGMRDLRVITPRGASTLGQIVVVRDPIVVEAANNDTMKTAQAITLPAAVCGALEKQEDVDFYKFKVAAGTALTFAMPFGLLGLLSAGALHHWVLGFVLLATAYLNRVALSIAAGWGVVRDRRALRMAWLYSLRDLMGFAFWCASYSGRMIVWRGDWYRLVAGGRMVLAQPSAASVPQTLAKTEAATPTTVGDSY